MMIWILKTIRIYSNNTNQEVYMIINSSICVITILFNNSHHMHVILHNPSGIKRVAQTTIYRPPPPPPPLLIYHIKIRMFPDYGMCTWPIDHSIRQNPLKTGAPSSIMRLRGRPSSTAPYSRVVGEMTYP